MSEFLEETKKRLRNPYYVLLLLILGAATYLRFRYAFFDGMWVDEGRYARIGTEISSHILDYSVEWRGDITAFPPFYSYLIAFSTYIFGKTEFAVRAVSPIMGVAGVGLTYVLGKEMKNRETGLLAAALLTLNPIFWFLSERILIGATFATVYTSAILALYYGLEDRKYSKYALWALGPLVVLNILTKQPGYSLGIIIPLYFIYKKQDELKELLLEEVKIKESKFYRKTLTDRNYYIPAGLGLIAITPWAIRNTLICGLPLCGIARATGFAGKTTDATLTSVQDTFYFVTSMPSIVTLPVAALLAFRISQYLMSYVDEDPDYLVKYGAALVAASIIVYFVMHKLLPLVVISSIALVARNDAEKLLWLWIGIGIGFMSVPTVKVPRYIVFTIPGLLIVASIALYSVSSWLSENLEIPTLTAPRIAALAVIPILFLSFTAGLQNISQGGFAQLEPAGNWISNQGEEVNIVASSPAIMRYYIYPGMAHRFPDNKSEMKNFIQENDIEYVAADVYERTQPEWAQTDIPPYRIPNSVRAELNRGRISPEEASQMFSQPPDYLVPVKNFGQTRLPLTKQQSQPVVMVYQVNKTALE